ncbi:hypothetical protein DL96DRAFT_1628511 [Flagelloscypha sp. PMI_526]|nr:hypothetical protein DL96DRAFT_1628511 [Flagelloscypha sp. PMI_526]
MASTPELPSDTLGEIFGNLSRLELAKIACLSRAILPLVQIRLYSSLNLYMREVRAIVDNSLHLLVHTRTLRLTYSHRSQNFSHLPSFFSTLLESGNLRSVTLVNQRVWEDPSKPQVLGVLFGSMQRFLQSLHSLIRLSIEITPPASPEGISDYRPFVETALVHPALQSVSIRLWLLTGFTLTEGTISSPIERLCVFLGSPPSEEEGCKRIFRHLDLTGLRELFLDTSFHSFQHLPDFFSGIFASCSIKSLTIRTDHIITLPSIPKALRPSENLTLHLFSYGTTEDFRNLMDALAGSLKAFPHTSLTSLAVVIMCDRTVSFSFVVSSEEWYQLRSVLTRFKYLSRVTIQITGSTSNDIPPLTIQDRATITDALKDGLSPSCSLTVFSAVLPKL